MTASLAGAVPDPVMARYLVQDYRLSRQFPASARCGACQRRHLRGQAALWSLIGMMSVEENTYFLRAFEALGVTETRRQADPDTQPTIGFKAIMREAADMRSYAAVLSVLVLPISAMRWWGWVTM